MTNHNIGRLSTQPLSPEQEQLLQQLVASLSLEQALWVSGFLSGLAGQGGLSLSPAAPAGREESLTLLFASESGNAAAVARSVAGKAENRGIAVTVHDLSDYPVRALKKETTILFVTSTHGDGDPPDTAATFFEDLLGKRAPKLTELSYAVLSLGDSTYEFFCEAGKTLDRRLEELGANRIHNRVDCDVDFEGDAEAWTEAVLGKIAASSQPAVSQPTGAGAGAAFAPQANHSKANPYTAEVLENICITGRGSSKVVNHMELSIEGSGLTYEPGDALGIIPRNDPALVEDLLAALSPAIMETGDGTPLAQALEEEYEIGMITPSFLEFWAERSDSDFLATLVEPEARVDRFQYLGQHHLLDLVQSHPVPGLSADELTGALRKLQPRLYSIASSPAAFPGEVHLTVGLLSYELRGSSRRGVASGHVCERLGDEGHLPVYVQRNDNFRLPDDDVPAIMISAGTGIAPFRGFVFERQERGTAGKNWLFFGDRQSRTDFLYQTEWQAFLKNGSLNRMDVAFSRDQAEKIYIQQRLREASKNLYAWLQEGAHIYVCGSIDRLAPAVDEALLEIIAKEGDMRPQKAAEQLKDLQKHKRYQKDVY